MRMIVGAGGRAVIADVNEASGFDIPYSELRELHLAALNERLQERGDKIKLVNLRAQDAGVSEIRSLDDIVPLLLPLVLIASQSLLSLALPAGHVANRALLFLGWPVVALGIGVLFAYGNATADQMYEASVAQLRRGSTATARTGLRQLLQKYPTSERVPDALYFMGQSYAAENPVSAAAYYNLVV